MTSINYQNTWHSKESDLNYGPGTPSYYQAKFSHALNDKNRWFTHGVWKQSKVRVTDDDLQVEIVHLEWDSHK